MVPFSGKNIDGAVNISDHATGLALVGKYLWMEERPRSEVAGVADTRKTFFSERLAADWPRELAEQEPGAGASQSFFFDPSIQKVGFHHRQTARGPASEEEWEVQHNSAVEQMRRRKEARPRALVPKYSTSQIWDVTTPWGCK